MKKKIVILFVLLILVVASFYVLKPKETPPLAVQRYELSASTSTDVFSLLQSQGMELETKYYEGMGILVESIDGVKNGQDNKYWQYWVNGVLGEVASDKKELKLGDKVEWIFDKAPEL